MREERPQPRGRLLNGVVSNRLQKFLDELSPGGDALTDFALHLGIVRGERQSDSSLEDAIVELVNTQYGGDRYRAIMAVSGKHHKEFGRNEEMAALMLAEMVGRAKLADSLTRGDTYGAMSPFYFANVLTEQGFERVLDYPFDHGEYGTHHFAIWVRRAGALLVETEGDASRVVIANLHYELALPGSRFEDVPQEAWAAAIGLRQRCGQRPFAHDGYVGYEMTMRCDEGFIAHLEALKASGMKTHNPWRDLDGKTLFLWDSQERSTWSLNLPQSHYKAIRNRKLEMLPKDIQEMLGYDPTRPAPSPDDDYLFGVK